MASSNWSAAENLNALDAGMLEAVRALGSSRLLRETQNALMPPSMQIMLDRQRSIEQWARELGGYNFDPHATAVLAKLNLADATSVTSFTDLARATELHSQLSQVTEFVENASRWTEIQQSIAGLVGSHRVMAWDDIKRLTDTMGLEASTVHQLSRICDFDRLLRAAMLEPAHVAWSTHLRTTALPTLSFLAQTWSKPLGLMTDLGRSEMGVSVAWLTRHHGESLVMMAAITPQADTKDGLEVIVEDEVVCALCGNLMITIGSNVKWIGPRREVRQRRVFPMCSECCPTESQFLYDALCDLTRPAVAIRRVIRGGGQGDGRPRGALRLVRIEDDHDKP